MKQFLILLGIIAALSGFSSAQNINGRFSSSLYGFERFDSVGASDTHLRAYELLSLNINKDKFSLRSYLNLETDVTEQQLDDPRLRFYNLYFEARDIFDVATLKLGRQPLFNSPGGGLFDGVHLGLNYNRFKLTGYYGGNVPAYQKFEVTDDWNNDYVFGGKFTANILPEFDLGVGYINKNFKPQEYYAIRLDEELNPVNTLIRMNSNQFRLAFAEASYEMRKMFSADIRYDYDVNLNETSKFEFNGAVNSVENFRFTAYYNYREPLIRYNSIFSVFDYGNTQEIEGGVDYILNQDFTFSGKFGYVTYKDENSQRITVGVLSGLGSLTYRKNLGYSGELDAVSLYTAHTFLEGLLTPSVGLSYSNYKLSLDSEKNNLTSVLAGLNIRPWRPLSFDLQGQFLNNTIYKNDFRFFFKVNYWFNTNLNLM
jgi:hypothetical protein